jgi:hypothetical protein
LREGNFFRHDIHERTAEALQRLLNELKLADFHIVHVVPAGVDRPKTADAVDGEENDLDPPTPVE